MKLKDKINNPSLNATNLLEILENVSILSISRMGSVTVTVQNYKGTTCLDNLALKALSISKQPGLDTKEQHNTLLCEDALKKWYETANVNWEKKNFVIFTISKLLKKTFYNHTNPLNSNFLSVKSRILNKEIANILKQDFIQDLHQWIINGGLPENQKNRRIAVNRIEEVYEMRKTLLNLSNLSLTSIPVSIGNLYSLQELCLNNNLLTSLPKTIGNLNNLKKFSVTDNELRSLPETFGDLSNLNELDLSDNFFHDLPPELGRLKNLTTLWIDNNQQITLPWSLGACTKLTTIVDQWVNIGYSEAVKNQIKEIIQTCKSDNYIDWVIQKTDLHNNDLLDLTYADPDKLSQNIKTKVFDQEKFQVSLKNLYLPTLMFETLPDSIKKLKNLKTLSFK